MFELSPVISVQPLKFDQVTSFGTTSTGDLHAHPDSDYFTFFTTGSPQTSVQFYTAVDGSPIFFAFAQADYPELTSMDVRAIEYVSGLDVWVVLGVNGDAAIVKINDLDSFPTGQVLWRGTITGLTTFFPRALIHHKFGSRRLFVSGGTNIIRLEIETPTDNGGWGIANISQVTNSAARVINRFHRLDGQDIILAYGTSTGSNNKIYIISGDTISPVTSSLGTTSAVILGAWYDNVWDRVFVMYSDGNWFGIARSTGVIQSSGTGTIAIGVSQPTSCFYVKKMGRLFVTSAAGTKTIYQCTIAPPATSNGVPTLAIEQSYVQATNMGAAPPWFFPRLKQLVFSGGHLLKFK